MPRYSEYDDTVEKTMGINARGLGVNRVNRQIEKGLLGVLNATNDSMWDSVYHAARLEDGDDAAGMQAEDVAADIAAHEGKKRLERAREAEEWKQLQEQIDASRQRVLKMQDSAAEAAEAEAARLAAEEADGGPPEEAGFGKSSKRVSLAAAPISPEKRKSLHGRKSKFDAALQQVAEEESAAAAHPEQTPPPPALDMVLDDDEHGPQGETERPPKA